MLKIITFPNKILTTPSENIDINGPEKEAYLSFIREFADIYNKGEDWGQMVGLAAPQVGKNWNIFIAFGNIFINPRIDVDFRKGFSNLLEGCYSLEKNRFDYPVKRAYKIKVEWTDVTGHTHKKTFTGFDAQIIQHEYDHLMGKCCLDGGIKII